MHPFKPFSCLAQVHNYGHVWILPAEWCDHTDATCRPQSNFEASLPYSQRSEKPSQGKYLSASSKVSFLAYVQTFLLQKFKLRFGLQRSQRKAHLLINKRTPFTQAPQKYTKVLSSEQFSWNVFNSGVLNHLSISRVSYGPDFIWLVCCWFCFVFVVVFSRGKVPWEVNSVFSYRKKYLL